MTALIIIFLWQLSIAPGPFWPATSSRAARLPQSGSSGFRVRQPNLHTPDLFADKIEFIATLSDLPGAKKKQSYWELSYQLFFLPEDNYYEGLKRLPKGGSNPPPEHFHGKILLAEGHKKRMPVSTLNERTLALTEVPFKQKIPDAQRTKFSLLMTAYSVKIFDAQLNTTLYLSGILLTEPYEENQKQDIPRRKFYFSMRVTPSGTLNYSQLPPNLKI